MHGFCSAKILAMAAARFIQENVRYWSKIAVLTVDICSGSSRYLLVKAPIIIIILL